MTQRVTIDFDQGVAHVRLSRPDKLNALDAAMFEALLAAGREVRDNTAVRAVVLAGEGRAFCAGLDVSMFGALVEPAADSQEGRRTSRLLDQRDPDSPANHAQRACLIWQEVPVPVIAAVQGVAFGGGLQLALGADMRYVHPDARLALREIEWGIIPDMAGSQALRHLVGLDVAKELTLTGREVTGEEALALGLATRVSGDPVAEAEATARAIAGRSPHAVRAAKELLNTAARCTPIEGLLLEERLQRALLGSPNQREAVKAKLAKRTPQFQDPT